MVFKEGNMNYKYEENNIECQYDLNELSGHSIVNAKYIRSFNPFFAGNPFIEALPPLPSRRETITLCEKQIYDKKLTIADDMVTSEKLDLVMQLQDIRFVLPYQLVMEYEFRRVLISAYKGRNIKVSKYALLDVVVSNEAENINSKTICEPAPSSAAGFSLLGFSGCGKTSAIKSLFDHYPQVIFHSFESIPRLIQITYLYVCCSPNSNFSALYVAIARAIDDSLGNIVPFYERQVSSKRSLSEKMDKIRELIELFSVGVIVIDEIQYIDFRGTRENSIQTLLTLTNSTQVGLIVLGTEDAHNKMCTNLQLRRRLGRTIIAHRYCENYDFFNTIVHRLFKYQWFNEQIHPSKELVDCLFSLTKGIIDQLISLYILMHLDYYMLSKKPTIDSNYIISVFDKHCPGLKEILNNLQDPYEQEKLDTQTTKTHEEIQSLFTLIQEQEAIKEVTEYNNEVAENDSDKLVSSIPKENIIGHISKRILSYFDDYNEDTVLTACEKVYKALREEIYNEDLFIKYVIKTLLKGKSDKRARSKSPLSPEEQHAQIREFIAEQIK